MDRVHAYLSYLEGLGLLPPARRQDIVSRLQGPDFTKAINYAVADYLRNLKLT
jgi:hypothetical protein